MKRRHFISLASIASFMTLGSSVTHAQISDLSDAINKAGRQRMLSQRMGKAWLASLHGIDKMTVQPVLDKSIALFDTQLQDLKAFAPNADIKATYTALEGVWGSYKTALIGVAPSIGNAAALLQLDSKVLALAHQGTVQYEAALGKPLGKLVNVAGRQRMLSQRMAKFFLAAKLPVDAATATTEITKARTEFVTAMEVLRNAPEATPRIKDELQLADGQWIFFDMALQKLQLGQNSSKAVTDVFTASENLLTVMDHVTGMYSSVKI